MNQAKINLNVHAENEISWEPRMQIMLASGAFVISEKISSNDLLRPGIDYIEAKSPAHMQELVEYYLIHDEERENIAENGRQRILDQLDSATCFKGLIENIESGNIQKYAPNPGKVIYNLISALINKNRRLLGWLRR
jgi:spore maturation protein CgeB